MYQPTLDVLQEWLRSGEPETRRRAVQELALRVTKDPALHSLAQPVFESALQTEQNPYTLIAAARGLETILGLEGARPAWMGLIDHADVRIVERVVLAVRDRSYLRPLAALLERWDDVMLRQAVVRTLGRMRDPAALPIIAAQLAHPNVRAHAVEALADLGDPRAIPVLYPYLDDRSEAWQEDNHGPMLYIRNLAQDAIARLQTSAAPRAAPGRN